jgi:hypothetical protein
MFLGSYSDPVFIVVRITKLVLFTETNYWDYIPGLGNEFRCGAIAKAGKRIKAAPIIIEVLFMAPRTSGESWAQFDLYNPNHHFRFKALEHEKINAFRRESSGRRKTRSLSFPITISVSQSRSLEKQDLVTKRSEANTGSTHHPSLPPSEYPSFVDP